MIKMPPHRLLLLQIHSFEINSKGKVGRAWLKPPVVVPVRDVVVAMATAWLSHVKPMGPGPIPSGNHHILDHFNG
jgi:hypothetical protein